MGSPGIELVESLLPALRKKEKVDLVIAQAENVTEGRGITLQDFRRLQQAGIDFCTGGNWTIYRDAIFPALEDPTEPIIRPANYEDIPGKGYKTIKTTQGSVLVVSLLGQIVGRDADRPTANPLQTIDKILDHESAHHAAIVVNFHGDFSSEKRIIGYYLDGRVSMVVGDHWHVPTADADVLPKGTAHITDVGMCGSLDSSLGITLNSVIPRWRNGTPTRNVLETAGRQQFNAVLAQIDPRTHLAKSVRHIQEIVPATN